MPKRFLGRMRTPWLNLSSGRGNRREARVYWFPDPEEGSVRLAVVSDDFLATGSFWPLRLGASVEYPFVSEVGLLTSDEWARVEAGSMPLPAGVGPCKPAAGMALTRRRAFIQQARSDFAVFERLLHVSLARSSRPVTRRTTADGL